MARTQPEFEFPQAEQLPAVVPPTSAVADYRANLLQELRRLKRLYRET